MEIILLKNKIKEILSSKMNEFIADSVIRVNCKRIGINPEELKISQLPEFAEKLKISLSLFLSEEETKEIVKAIKKTRL